MTASRPLLVSVQRGGPVGADVADGAERRWEVLRPLRLAVRPVMAPSSFDEHTGAPSRRSRSSERLSTAAEGATSFSAVSHLRAARWCATAYGRRAGTHSQAVPPYCHPPRSHSSPNVAFRHFSMGTRFTNIRKITGNDHTRAMNSPSRVNARACGLGASWGQAGGVRCSTTCLSPRCLDKPSACPQAHRPDDDD